MLAAAPVWVQALDGAGLAAGGLVLVLWCLSVTRRRAWSAPVSGPALSDATPIHAVLAFAGYFLAQSLAAGAVVSRYPSGELDRIGSDAWHALMLAADASKCAVIVAILIVIYAQRRHWRHPPSTVGAALAFTVGGALAALPLSQAQVEAARVLFEWSGHPIPEHPVILVLQAGGLSPATIGQLVIGAVIVAPVCEEVLFRGVVQDAVQNATGRFWPAAIVSAALFGLVHVPQPHAVIPLATLGIVLSIVRVQTGRLWPAILLHALFNGRTIALVLAGETNL